MPVTKFGRFSYICSTVSVRTEPHNGSVAEIVLAHAITYTHLSLLGQTYRLSFKRQNNIDFYHGHASMELVSLLAAPLSSFLSQTDTFLLKLT